MPGDAMDIMEVDRSGTPEVTKESIMGGNKRADNSRRRTNELFKRPEGMNRELYNLFMSDSKDPLAPVVPTDMIPGMEMGGYKQVKAKFGLKKVRKWVWTPFENPGRKDGFKLHHWRREVDAQKEYQFARFNTQVAIANYTAQEYNQYLQAEDWSKEETDHLFDLCKKFDLRFVIIQDRWDRSRFKTARSVEDLKERYYNAVNSLQKAHIVAGQEAKIKAFDAVHERKRKEQLNKLYNRTPEQIEEEKELLDEMRKIEARKKERERKTQDLQKLITAADSSMQQARKAETAGPGRPSGRPGRKKLSNSRSAKEATTSSTTNLLDSAGIKFPDNKTSGAGLRSAKMKLPASVGQKKSKAIDQLLQELSIDARPIPTEEICNSFNELRSDMVLLYELKMALANCEFELQTLKHQHDALRPDTSKLVPPSAAKQLKTPTKTESAEAPAPTETPPQTEEKQSEERKGISEVIDVTPGLATPNRKRRQAAMEQEKNFKKIIKKAV